MDQQFRLLRKAWTGDVVKLIEQWDKMTDQSKASILSYKNDWLGSINFYKNQMALDTMRAFYYDLGVSRLGLYAKTVIHSELIIKPIFVSKLKSGETCMSTLDTEVYCALKKRYNSLFRSLPLSIFRDKCVTVSAVQKIISNDFGFCVRVSDLENVTEKEAFSMLLSRTV